MEIKGTYTALITPFKNGELDLEGLRQNIRHQIKEGISGILPLGTTGETPTLSRKEQDEIIKASVEEAHGKVPVMVGTGSNCTHHTIENTKRAKELGADIVLVVTPYYNKPTQEGIFRHFKAVVNAVDIPLVVYNIQGRTGKNIETSTLIRIAQLRNIIGVKEASGNINQMGDVIQQISSKHKSFNVMSGDDSLTLPLIALGGKGVVSVVSNLLPGKVSAMVNAGLEGDFERARELHYELLPLFKGAFIETNPIPIKEAMNMCGMAAGDYRMPMCEMLPENKEKLKKILEEMGLL
ncbi:4-hydroxy-tetrahydrodipicolinate synthase [Candidatus Woesearchaeota archaeon]|nr:4-hydroxy-tetrahydrodipicolinate synthase [Candidatus Woesearchaeota archaeon]